VGRGIGIVSELLSKLQFTPGSGRGEGTCIGKDFKGPCNIGAGKGWEVEEATTEVRKKRGENTGTINTDARHWGIEARVF